MRGLLVKKASLVGLILVFGIDQVLSYNRYFQIPLRASILFILKIH
jgi:hypothetical protein